MGATYPTDFEKGRLSGLGYEGKRIRAFLAYDPLLTLSEGSLRTAWEGLQLPIGNGYSQVSFVVPTGAYDNGDDRYEVGDTGGVFRQVQFTATGAGYTYNRVCWVVGTSDGVGGWNDENYLSFITPEDPFLQLLAGQTAIYNFQIGIRGVVNA
jgi:hypothetical protein